MERRNPLIAAAMAVLAATPFASRPSTAAAQHPAHAPSLIPYPEHVRQLPGSFTLRDSVRIVADTSVVRLREIATLLADALRARTGFTVTIGGIASAGGAITLESRGGAAEAEDYSLTVAPRGVHIAATSSRGVLWGVQTLRQLLPPAFDDPDGARPASWSIPAVEIRDRPRFAWRGSLFDVSRHFFLFHGFFNFFFGFLHRFRKRGGKRVKNQIKADKFRHQVGVIHHPSRRRVPDEAEWAP